MLHQNIHTLSDDSGSEIELTDGEMSEEEDTEDTDVNLKSKVRDLPISNRSEQKYLSTNGVLFTGCLSGLSEITFTDYTLVVRASLDNKYWAVGLSDGSIKLFTSMFTKSSTAQYSLVPTDQTGACTDIRFVPYPDQSSSEKKHILIATYASGQVRVWHYTGAGTRCLATITEEMIKMENDPQTVKSHNSSSREQRRHRGTNKQSENKDTANLDPLKSKLNNQILACDCSMDGQRFITGGEDCHIRVYDLAKLTVINTCYSPQSGDRMIGHVMRICSLRYHPWGVQYPQYAHIFVSGGWDDTVQIWDDRYQHSIWQYIGPHICGTDSLDIDPYQNHIVTSSWRRNKGILQVWKFKDDIIESPPEDSLKTVFYLEKPIAEMKEDTPSMGYVAQWLHQRFIIYAGSNNNMIKIIDRGSMTVVGQMLAIPNGVYSVATQVPPPDDIRKPILLAFCSGNSLQLIKMDRK